MVGAVGGALAILEVMPKKYKHMLGGPKLKVPVETGVVAEAVLTFAITLIVLWAILRGPRNTVVKTFIIIGATIALVMAGGAYTGPAMNPANAFGWAFVSNQHTSWEHFAVYWVGPMIGTIVSVWAFNLLFGAHQALKPSKGGAKPAKSLKKGTGEGEKIKKVKSEVDSSDDVAGKVKAS
jgi:aquaporin SIP